MTSSPDAPPAPRGRRVYIDWARGIAVLVMIEAHTLDAWTRAAERSTPVFRDAQILGGFAAPLFLWLAGVGVVLSAARTAERCGSRGASVDTICRRGLEIFLLAFLFRLQSFLLSPGTPPAFLFRVDILNVMGPMIVAAGLIWGLPAAARSTWRLVIAYAAVAAAIALLTPIVRASAAVNALPIWFQWYVRPAGDYTVFTLFPWAGFIFAGGACGVLLAAASGREAEQRLHRWLGPTGLALIAAGLFAATLPSLYRQSSFWTTSPAYFAIRVGVMMAVLAAAHAAAGVLERAGIALPMLERLGRNSLFVYWIHVELVYGYASWLWRGRLPLWGTAIAFALFSALMYQAIQWRDDVVSAWRGRRGPIGQAPQAVTA
ncbi:MAG TPA: heparan-alpha-glucosaminide N-acetyltransferase domain-containing protein [Vicinamibacterales bacterium]|nr:heparan-alpha-glucosaminide N-acetyltransferase domain-containing protein [Vicinamibacterales bacterium]